MHRVLPDPGIIFRAAVMAVALAALPAALSAQGSGVALQRVERIGFEGREQVSEKALFALMKTRRPSRLPWVQRPVLRLDFLRADTLAIGIVYRRHGYLDARARFRIEPGTNPGLSRVVFEIDEGQQSRVGRVSLKGAGSMAPQDLLRKLQARKGRPFDPSIVIADTARISRELQERGHIPGVDVTIRRDSLAVDVHYEIHEGPLYNFGEVYLSVAGESRIREPLIRRELLIPEGEVYRFSRVERSQEQLSESGFFRQVSLERLVDSSRAVVDWELSLRERKPRWIDAGVGSGTAERFRFTGEWGHRNIFGRGLQGVLASRLAFDGSGNFLLSRVEATLLEPWFLRTRTRGQVTPYYERSNFRANPNYVIDQERKGFEFRLRRAVGRVLRVSLVQDNAFVLQRIEFRDATPDTVRDSLLAVTEPRYSTHRLQLGIERDRRDFPFNPGRGSMQTSFVEIAGGPFQGSSSFWKAEGGSSWYTPLPNRWVVATRLRTGAIDPFGDRARFTPEADLDSRVARVPSEDRFRLGGATTIRGYDENELPAQGGLGFVLANVEVRMPVKGPFGLEFFLDAGNVWARPSYIKAEDFVPSFSNDPLEDTDVRYVYGVGGRLNLPFGPLRLDYAWSPRPEAGQSRLRGKWQVAIGPAF